jgi:citrate synthase
MVDQRRFDDQRSTLDARAAAALLGVDRRTLYAYVARGLVRSFPGPRGRARQYAREDLERLRARTKARAGHAAVASGALRFGEPVLDSSITAVDPRGIRYRGRDLGELVEAGVGYEATAELLWTGALPEAPPRWRAATVPWARLRALVRPTTSPLVVMALAVNACAAVDPDAGADEGGAALERARGIVGVLARALAPGLADARLHAAADAPTIAGVCAKVLGCRAGAEGRRALELALVLCADHELNASTFAARIAASTGSDLHACLAAALAVMTGPRHGAAALRVDALLDEIGAAGRAAAVVRARLQRGEAIPGFGQPMYRDGDPRAPPLLAAARAIAPRHPRVKAIAAVVATMAAAGRDRPNVDLGLAAIAAALALPRGSASGLFALGRSAGWIAHALEQRASAFVLRPRARYIGPARP